MIAHRSIVFGTLFALLLAMACGQSAEPTPEPTAAPTPVPSVTKQAPTLDSTDDRPLVDVSHLLDFVREGTYRNSDGVGGAAWLDYDGDGFLDLYITNTRDEKTPSSITTVTGLSLTPRRRLESRARRAIRR